MLPMTSFEHAREAYIEAYGSDKFYAEINKYIELSGKTINEVADDEITRHGVYDVVLLHRRVKLLHLDER